MEIKNDELEKLYADTFRSIGVGSILKGSVIALKEDSVVVDIGYKSEGIIPKAEFSPEERSNLKVGDSFEVYVEAIRDAEGMLVLSKDRASRLQAWGLIESCFSSDSPLEGTVIAKTKGGLFVNVSGVRAFLPSSHIDIKAVKNLDFLIGKKMMFKVLKLNNKRSNVIVSRKIFMEEDRRDMKIKTLEKIKAGSLMKGVVKNITDYGVFVDLGGLDGLLHISDISWGRITHPSEFFAVDDEIEVVVVKYDEESQRVTLGYKQKKPDPWAEADTKYPVGATIKGNVMRITDYGAFIEIEEGLEGLVHISEIDWSPRPKHPSKYLSVGEVVEAMVLKVDKVERRLSLSTKQLKPSHWKLIEERYKTGQVITGKIRGVTEFGAFVSFPEGVDGLIHISDISWTKHIKHPSEVLKKGQKIEAVILNIEPEKEKIALGIKQLKPDPWLSEIPEKFRLGDEKLCEVLKITEFGIFVELENELEGLIYASEIIEDETPIKEQDKVWARIIKIDIDQRKIGLSMKNVKRSSE